MATQMEKNKRVNNFSPRMEAQLEEIKKINLEGIGNLIIKEIGKPFLGKSPV